jgi:hypothetical protein
MYGLEQLVDRQHLHARRAARRRSRDKLGALQKSDKREVARAVRGGRAVVDPQLAPAAVAFASSVLASGGLRPLGWVNRLLGLAWFSVPAVVAGVRHRWALAAILALWPLLIVAGMTFSFKRRAGASEALELNRRLVGRLPSSASDLW